MKLILLNVAGYAGRDLNQLLTTLRERFTLRVEAAMDVDEHHFDPAVASLAVESLGLIIAGISLALQAKDRRPARPGTAQPATPEPPSALPSELPEQYEQVVKEVASLLDSDGHAITVVSGYRLTVTVRREVLIIEGTVDTEASREPERIKNVTDDSPPDPA